MRPPRFLQSSAFAIDFLIGLPDGIMIPLALAAALSPLHPAPGTIALICFIEVVFMAVLMGVASYFTIVNQAEENVDLIPEMKENNPNRFARHLQLRDILSKLELGKDALQQADYETVEYHKHWTALLQNFGIGTPLPDFARARKSGTMVALSFLVGGLLPVVPYLWAPHAMAGLQYAVALSVLGLIGVGIFKALYTGISAWKESIRLVLICILTSGATFLVFYMLSK